MAWGTHAARRAAVVDLAVKAEARATEHRAREASYRAQGKADKADGHAATASRQERIATTHRQEIERLDQRAKRQAVETLSAGQRAYEMARAEERAAAAAAAQPEVDPLLAYMEALESALLLENDADRRKKNAPAYDKDDAASKADLARRGAEIARKRASEWRLEAERIQSLTPRDLPRELKAAVRARRQADSQDKNESKRRADLGVVSNLSTAAGQREIATGGRDRGLPVASLRDYASLIKRPQDRTRVRLEFMEKFDSLCATADAGLFPEPKFENESGSGQGPGPLVMLTRAAGLAEMDDLRFGLGARNIEMLRAWIYERVSVTGLARMGYGSERNMSAVLLATLDALIAFAMTGSALAAAEAGLKLSPQARPSAPASADQVSLQSQGSEPETSNRKASQKPRIQPEAPQPWSNRLAAGDRPPRATIACPEPIGDDARRTILARGASRGPE